MEEPKRGPVTRKQKYPSEWFVLGDVNLVCGTVIAHWE